MTQHCTKYKQEQKEKRRGIHVPLFPNLLAVSHCQSRRRTEEVEDE